MKGRPTTDAPRQRRWTHQMWREGPMDMKVPPAAAAAAMVGGSSGGSPSSSPTTSSPRQFIAANLPNARDAASRAASNEAADTCSRDVVQLGRGKMFDTRGLCMTPGVRAAGPSYMKPLPPPMQRPANPQPHDEPAMVIVRTVASRQEIIACSEAAMRYGIRPGLTLTEARALCAKVVAFAHDPRRDARALEALGRWMTRFTPFVSLPPLPRYSVGEGRGEGAYGGDTRSKADPLAHDRESEHLDSTRPLTLTLSHGVPRERGPEEDCLYLDLTGCERVFGGLSNIVRAVIDSLSHLRLSAGVAVAPTPGAAWAVASFGENGKIVPDENVATEISSLPVAALRLDETIRESLHHLGIETIDQLMNLPRSALPSRFGPTLLLRLDQALGRAAEPLVPLLWHAPIEARMEFEGPIDSWETIWVVFKRLIERVIVDLVRRGCGARRVEVEFHRADKKIVRHAIALSRPSRDPKNLFNLIRCATENVDGGDDGFLAIRLHVPVAERIDPEQIALLGREQYEGEIEFSGLIERLTVRLGDGVIARPTLVESHVPERAFSFAWHGRLAHAFERSDLPADRSAIAARARRPCHDQRPLQLLPEPVEIRAVVTPSEDRDGRPVLFRLGRDVHQLRHAIGPERISGEWWRGHDKTRDYFDVEDEQGKRFWVFRVNETSRWYLHGSF